MDVWAFFSTRKSQIFVVMWAKNTHPIILNQA